MTLPRMALIATATFASLASGLSKQVEAPLEAAAFARAGLPVEILSLFGAVELVLALLLLLPRPRRAAAVCLAASFAFSAYLLMPHGLGWLVSFNAAMVLLVLVAGFWRGGALFDEPSYQGAIPLGFSKPRR